MSETFHTYRQIGYSNRKVGFGKKPAIIVVDFQRAFLDEKFPLGRSSRLRQAAEHTADLLDKARAKQIPIIHTVVGFRDQWDLGNWKMDIQWITENSEAAELSPILKAPASEPVIVKKAPSAFFGTDVVRLLTSHFCDTVIVTGCVTSGCIRATVIDSFSYGYKTIIPEECVGDYTEEQHRANLFDVNNRYADVVSKAEVMDYLETK
jgi:maleamate amidohydrolase